MRRTTGPPHSVGDLREKLNRKRQERAEQNATCDITADWKRNGQRPPPDPPSFLRDPLRGDEITKDTQADNNGQHLRGHRGRGGRGRKPPAPKTKPLNIIVEFSNPGERTCTIDESLEVHIPINSKQERGYYRGNRNFRRPQRNRGSYSGRNRENKVPVLHDENFKSQEVDKRWNKSEKYKMVPSIETTEDWTTDEPQGAVNNKSKDWIPSVKTTEDWTADKCQGAVKDKSKDEIPSIQTTEDWTTDEPQGGVNNKSKDWIPSVKATEDWTADECQGAVKDKSKDGIPSIQSTDEIQEAVSDKSKDGIRSIKTTEDWTPDEYQGVNDNSKDSNDQNELAQVPNDNAEVFSPNLEEDSKEEKVGKEKEEKVKEVDYKPKPAENNSVTE